MRLEWLTSLTADEATRELRQCCGSKRWAEQMSADRPYATVEDLLTNADRIWWSLTPDDWLEAFRSHPKIGEKKASDNVSAQSQHWSGHEQAGMSSASQETADSLAELNRAYEQKFGFIFIICATGKSSAEMLAALKERIQHDSDTELRAAAAEQAQITALRLKKLLISA
ncbi:MAG TPA: 2-oxo-4-hydroxy-4-carboxy-5-ureidoimidazoline decarboxylase [Pyrinomonadaceae bacterium]|nr:2-oxo-4-hydroxy-4-carboxy-5-ureidoimidazoline decarboxylase [Pyrinomonadaceae bacterium]